MAQVAELMRMLGELQAKYDTLTKRHEEVVAAIMELGKVLDGTETAQDLVRGVNPIVNGTPIPPGMNYLVLVFKDSDTYQSTPIKYEFFKYRPQIMDKYPNDNIVILRTEDIVYPKTAQCVTMFPKDSLFGSPPPQNSLFGPPPPQNSLFGPSPQDSLFGPPSQDSLFGPPPKKVTGVHPIVNGRTIPQGAKYLVLYFAHGDTTQSIPIGYDFFPGDVSMETVCRNKNVCMITVDEAHDRKPRHVF